MLYAALTFWLLVIVFSAWGVHSLWSGMVKPRVVNAILLPGTLVAQLGHVVGLLITGNAVQNTTLMGDDEKGEPKSETPQRPRVPVIGPIVTGLLPLVACAACLYGVAAFWGGRVLDPGGAGAGLALPHELPTSLSGVWGLLRTTLTLSEGILSALVHSNLLHWQTALFLYLAVCLTVRMAPFEGNRRGALAAIVLMGIIIAILATLVPAVRTFIAESSWPILSFSVGMLVFLLLATLLVNGVVGLVRVLARNE